MKKIWLLFGLVLLAGVAAFFFPSVASFIERAFLALDTSTRLLVKLAIVGLLAIVAASLLSPLEALGWWAGWYGDSVETNLSPVTLQHPIAPNETISRYVIYLDGIGQADFTYMPEGEEFLDALAKALPDDIAIIRGIMPYSVLNRSLTSDRPFAWFWRLADQMRLRKPGNVLGFLINIRNMLTVSVSADLRYGPIYNRGMAQLMYNSLVNYGYQPGSGIPVTLVGFSGGGQISMGSAPLLKEALNAPIDVISLGGVFCGRNNSLKLEHIYHLAGDRDTVQRLGAILFPRRWKLFMLSYWNRTKKHGQISLLSLGKTVGHQNPGGVMDSQAFLPDGRSNLQNTVDWVSGILKGELPPPETLPTPQVGNYERYQVGAFNHPSYYPIQPFPPSRNYRSIAPWVGRLILPKPEERQQGSVWFEVHHAPDAYRDWVGKTVRLRWKNDPALKARNRSVLRDVHFNDDARLSLKQGIIHPERLNGWRLVDPLESLAGARPLDDMQVMLTGDVTIAGTIAGTLKETTKETTEETTEETAAGISEDSGLNIYIAECPTKIAGQYYALVQFIEPLEVESAEKRSIGQLYRVRHFNSSSRQFDGEEDRVLLPQVIPDGNDISASSTKDLERSPCNESGWYIYGAVNRSGQFVVQAIAPRALFQLQPGREIVGAKAAMNYLKTESWSNLEAKKGTVSATLLKTHGHRAGIAEWTEGTRALLVHNYGGIGGKKREPAAQGPVYFGHFSYGTAEVVREPLADELQFDLVYYQVYAHNGSGLLSCRHHWTSYMGDRQWGFLGIRPVCDLLIKLDSFTGYYAINAKQLSPLDRVVEQLDLMMARYRIGDGTGATYVGPANNCAQDSNQALYAALRNMVASSHSNSELRHWMQTHPEIASQLKQLERLGYSLKRDLLPFGMARADWKEHQERLGSSMEDSPIRQLLTGLGSWRTMLPRVASDAIARSFTRQGASVWVLRTNQVGGSDPDIEPIAPMGL
ncbi:CAAX protease [Leptolyngbya ohadii]|uniref:CAAX protease n=1 Tax=Leptolyngbya ohadii TaxID=1962290 RepID=UPI0015C5DD42|nr:CAAX protease [Leptolyngbya ohadii]